MRTVYLGLLLVATAACHSATELRVPLLAISTTSVLLQPSDLVGVRLSSLADEPLEYGVCGWHLLRFEDREWRNVPYDRGLLPCTAQLSLLEAGASAELRVNLGAMGTSGVYRLVFTAYDAASRLLPEEQRTTNPFRIQ